MTALLNIDPREIADPVLRKQVENAQARAAGEAASKTEPDGKRPNPKYDITNQPSPRDAEAQRTISEEREIRSEGSVMLHQVTTRFAREWREITPLLKSLLEQLDAGS